MTSVREKKCAKNVTMNTKLLVWRRVVGVVLNKILVCFSIYTYILNITVYMNKYGKGIIINSNNNADNNNNIY